jgi:hypothetical protein
MRYECNVLFQIFKIFKKPENKMRIVDNHVFMSVSDMR